MKKGGTATVKSSENDKGISGAQRISVARSSERLPGASRLQLVGDCRKTQGVSAGNIAQDLPKPDSSSLKITAECPAHTSGVVVTLPVQCGWCKLWRVDAVWTPVAPANSTLGKVSHSICPECYAIQMAQLEAMKGAA